MKRKFFYNLIQRNDWPYQVSKKCKENILSTARGLHHPIINLNIVLQRNSSPTKVHLRAWLRDFLKSKLSFFVFAWENLTKILYFNQKRVFVSGVARSIIFVQKDMKAYNKQGTSFNCSCNILTQLIYISLTFFVISELDHKTTETQKFV